MICRLVIGGETTRVKQNLVLNGSRRFFYVAIACMNSTTVQHDYWVLNGPHCFEIKAFFACYSQH